MTYNLSLYFIVTGVMKVTSAILLVLKICFFIAFVYLYEKRTNN